MTPTNVNISFIEKTNKPPKTIIIQIFYRLALLICYNKK